MLTFGWPSLVGVLDGVGRATVTLPLPNDPALDGLGLFASALTLDPALRPLDVTPDVATLLLR